MPIRLLPPLVFLARLLVGAYPRWIGSVPTATQRIYFANHSSHLDTLVLWAALHMYGHSLGLVQLIIINTLASILGGIAPVPGGIGVIEAGLIAGLTAAGVPDQAAIATTFTARTFTAYLPPIWGWMSIAWMRRRDYV